MLPNSKSGSILSPFKRLAIAIGLAALPLVGLQTPAHAFCVSNDSLSRSTLEVQQLRKDQYEPLSNLLKCERKHPTPERRESACHVQRVAYEKVSTYIFKSDRRFEKSIGPNQTFCCSHKNKDCNPGRKKAGDVYFIIQSHSVISSGQWTNADYSFFKLMHRAKATDHIVCRTFKVRDIRGKSYAQSKNVADTKAPECKKYSWPNTPPWPNENTFKNVMIKSVHTGKCLDIAGGAKGNRANVIMWKCHGRKNQRWTANRDGLIRSALSGKCLDLAVRKGVKNPKNGTNVHMYDCHRGKNQVWRYTKRTKQLQVTIGKYPCLEVGGWNKKDGANANVWQCAGKAQANQQWVLAK